MISTLLVLATLAAEPAAAAKAAAPAAAPAAATSEAPTAAAPSGPAFELLIPEQMIEDFLVAASPYQRTITENIELFGMTKKVRVDLTFRNPKVKVTPKGVLVTMDYEAHG